MVRHPGSLAAPRRAGEARTAPSPRSAGQRPYHAANCPSPARAPPCARDAPRAARRAAVLLLALAAAVALYEGWRAFRFLTDDAFIDFRYVQNSRLGLGYTWNAPPFRPVEGYTSLLWVALLDATWRLTGVPPPDSANVIGLFCGAGSLAATAFMLARVDLGDRLGPARLPVAAVALAGVVSNRTFLTWTSSGLETPLFVLLVLCWVSAALFSRARGARYALLVTALAALLELARPDGLLFWAASFPLVLAAPPAPGRRRALLGGWPLMVVPAHLLFRRWRYGAWLPNTYYAKVVAPWPEAGLRYLASFCLEYALWLLVPLALLALARSAPRLRSALADGATVRSAIVASAILAHVAYYTLRVGGDYFEYRVFAHLIPLTMVAAVWLIGRVSLPPAAGVAALAGLVAASLPIPWTLRSLEVRAPPMTRDRPYVLAAVAPAFPAFLQGYAGLFDDLQAWLIPHAICVRHEQHVRFFKTQAAKFPSREQGWAIDPSDHPILAIGSVGVAGWVAPRVAVLDRLGLNDAVVARTPVKPAAFRRMAHERHPPPGYIECFAPNVTWSPEGFTVTPRAVPVTDATIVDCETRFLAAVE